MFYYRNEFRFKITLCFGKIFELRNDGECVRFGNVYLKQNGNITCISCKEHVLNKGNIFCFGIDYTALILYFKYRSNLLG